MNKTVGLCMLSVITFFLQGAQKSEEEKLRLHAAQALVMLSEGEPPSTLVSHPAAKLESVKRKAEEPIAYENLLDETISNHIIQICSLDFMQSIDGKEEIIGDLYRGFILSGGLSIGTKQLRDRLKKLHLANDHFNELLNTIKDCKLALPKRTASYNKKLPGVSTTT